MNDLGRKSTILVGSSAQAHIKLDGSDVKPKHCEFYGIPNKKNPSHEVECHVGSVTGKISINGTGFKKVDDYRLNDKDIVIIGETTRWAIKVHFAEDNNLKDNQSPFDFEVGSYDEIMSGASAPSSSEFSSPSSNSGGSDSWSSSSPTQSTTDDW